MQGRGREEEGAHQGKIQEPLEQQKAQERLNHEKRLHLHHVVEARRLETSQTKMPGQLKTGLVHWHLARDH